MSLSPLVTCEVSAHGNNTRDTKHDSGLEFTISIGSCIPRSKGLPFHETPLLPSTLLSTLSLHLDFQLTQSPRKSRRYTHTSIQDPPQSNHSRLSVPLR